MIIGAIRLTFVVGTDGSSSRSTSQKLKERIWNRFKFTCIEVPSSAPNELVIGVASLGINETQTRNKIQDLIKHLNEWGQVELVNDEVELIHFEDIEAERNFEKYNP